MGPDPPSSPHFLGREIKKKQAANVVVDLRDFPEKLCITLPETNIAPENSGFQ